MSHGPQRLLERITGTEAEHPLLTRVFFAYLFAAVVAFSLATAHNSLAGFWNLAVATSLFVAAHASALVAVRGGYAPRRRVALALFVVNQGLMAGYWFVGGGLDGGGVVLLLSSAAIWPIVFTGRTLQVVVAVSLSVFASLVGIQLMQPALVPDIYAHPVDRALDVGISFVLVFAGVAAVVAVLVANYKRALSAIEFEQRRSESLLRNMLPASIAARLKATPGTIADKHDAVTVLFADLVGFTVLSEKLSPEALVAMLDRMFQEVDAAADRHGLEKIKTIGDAYMAAGGVPEARPDHADAVLAFARELIDIVAHSGAEHGLQVRIGIHTGPVVAGVIGHRKLAYDLWGDTVNTAARMESHGTPGRIQLTAATKQALSTPVALEAGGVKAIKGKGEMQTWLVAIE